MRILIAVTVAMLAAAPAQGAETAGSIEYRLKAEFIERFTRFIDWPDAETQADAGEPFVIGVYGDSPMIGALDDLIRRQSIRDRPAKLLRIDAPAQGAACDLLFIAGSQAERLPEVLSYTAGRPILTIGDTAGFARRGVLINFYREEGFIRFEVNPEAVTRSGLRFSSRLLRLATLIEAEGGG